MFFDLHGMKQWPNILAIIGLIVIVIASIADRRILGIATVAGYLGGFILAMIFNTDSLDQGGGRLNNAWIIWTAVFIISLVIGFILSVEFKRKK